MNTSTPNDGSYWFEENGGESAKCTMDRSTRTNSPPSDEAPARPASQLFTVRIWPELSEQGVVTWRGKVQHVPNGAWRYFQEWPALSTFLQSQVEALARSAAQESHVTQPGP